MPDEGVELEILQVIYFTLVRKHNECKVNLKIEDILLSGSCISHGYLTSLNNKVDRIEAMVLGLRHDVNSINRDINRRIDLILARLPPIPDRRNPPRGNQQIEENMD